MRKKFISLLLCGLLLSAFAQPTRAGFLDNENAIRQVALIVSSLVLTSGGTYLISKKSKGFFNKVLSIVGGTAMVALGFTGIVLSDSILKNVDYALEQAAKTQ